MKKGTVKKLTLVELVVIIAIIGILMSLLIAAMKKGKEETKKLQCLANLRTLSAGMTAYSGDHSGKIISGSRLWNYKYRYNHRRLQHWPTVPMLQPLGEYVGIITHSDRGIKDSPGEENDDHIIAPWMDSGLVSCPSVEDVKPAEDDGAFIETNYAYAGLMFPFRNSWGSDGEYTLKPRSYSAGSAGVSTIGSYQDPSRIMYFADLNAIQSGYTHVNHGPYREGISNGAALVANMEGTHVAYLDGGVRWVKPEKMGRQEDGIDQTADSKFKGWRFKGHNAYLYYW